MDASQQHDRPALRLTFTPQPTADERDAIIAALAVALLDASADVPDAPNPPISRWHREGRRTSMRGGAAAAAGAARGWGRSSG